MRRFQNGGGRRESEQVSKFWVSKHVALGGKDPILEAEKGQNSTNKADRHKSRAPSYQRPTDQPTDRPTKRLIESPARD